MNKRQAKKIRKKVNFPIADEFNLLTMTPEEHKQAMEEYDQYVQKYCRYKHYKDRGKRKLYFFPIGKQYAENLKKTIGVFRGHHKPSTETFLQDINCIKKSNNVFVLPMQ